MEKALRKTACLFGRYLIILIFALGNFYLLEKLLFTHTIKVLSAVLSLFGIASQGDYIYFGGKTTQVAGSCLILSAFFLLLLLTFSTASIKPVKRIIIISLTFTALFLLNIARMVLLVFIINKPYFNLVHFLLQNILSIPAVMGIWLCTVKAFNIKTIPIYSDIKYLQSLTKHSSHRRANRFKSI